MDKDILLRIQQLVSAFDNCVRTDLTAFPAKVYQDDKHIFFMQDYSGGATRAELTNAMQSILVNLGSFHDHLQAWGDKRGISRESVHNYLRRSFDVCVIMDLYNRDKHVHLDRAGWSRRKPYLGPVRSVLQMRTKPKAGSTIQVTMGNRGEPVASGDGSAEIVITADVLDKLGNGMGEVDGFIRRTVQYFEHALRDFNIRQS